MRYYTKFKSHRGTASVIIARLIAKSDRVQGGGPNALTDSQKRAFLGRLVREVKRANDILDGLSRNKGGLGKDIGAGRTVVSTLVSIAAGSGNPNSAGGALKSWAQSYFSGVPLQLPKGGFGQQGPKEPKEKSKGP